MNITAIIETMLFFGLGIALTPLLGGYMARVFKGERTLLSPLLLPIEKLCYKVTAVDPDEDVSWLKYMWAVVICALVGVVTLMTIFMTQQWLPLNPQKLSNVSWNMAFNEAWSFVCNADWQDYPGETTYSYFSQIAGLMVHQCAKWLRGLPVDPDLVLNLLAGELTAGNAS